MNNAAHCLTRTMNLKRLTFVAAIAAFVWIPALTSGTALVSAAPPDPPPDCPTCQQGPNGLWGIPAKKCWEYGRVGGGGPMNGGGVPGYLPQCKATAPAGPN